MSNFKLAIGTIQKIATATANLTASTTRPLTNLFSGSRSERFELATASTDILTINYDLGASTTKTANFLAIMRAKLLHRNDCTGVRLRGSTVSGLYPSTISPKTWYNANRGITLSSGVVSQWDDLSGNGYTGSQGTGANRPTPTQPAAGVNGNRILTFDGTNDSINTTYLPTMSSGFSFMAYIKPTITNYYSDIISCINGTAQDRFRFMVQDNGYLVVLLYNGSANQIARQTPAGTLSPGVGCVVGFTYDGGTVHTGIKIYKNGVQVDNADGGSAGAYTTPVGASTKSMEIGAENSGTSLRFNGVIAEVITSQSVWDTTTRQGLEAYLTTKYITTPIVQLDSLSTTTLMGPNDEDYLSVFAESSAFRHWWLEFVNEGTASKYNCSKVFFGKALDFGREPKRPISIKSSRQNAWSRETQHSATLEIGPISDTDKETFLQLVKDSDVMPVVALDPAAYVFNDTKGMHCKIVDHNVDPFFGVDNDITMTLEEEI